MRIVIVEDNIIEAAYIKSILMKEKDIRIVGEADNGNNALEVIFNKQPDVVFLDMSLPEMSGMEIASRISDNIKIVFITASSDFALSAYRFSPVDYILKPIDKDRVKEALNRIRKMQNGQGNKTITINIKGKIIFLDVKKILYIEKAAGYRNLIIHTNSDEYIFPGKLIYYEENLKNNGFVRTHKAFIINVSKLKEMIPYGDKSYIAKFHDSSKEVYISRKYAPVLKSMYRDT